MENKPEMTFIINQDVCKKCGTCKKACPADAIDGEVKKTFRINHDYCIRCGICFNKCMFQAIDQTEINEKDSLHCKKCGKPLSLPINLYINKKTRGSASYNLCEDCRTFEYAEKLLTFK